MLGHYFKKTASVQVRRLFLMRSKIFEFHLLMLKEATNVFRSVQQHGSRRNEVIYSGGFRVGGARGKTKKRGPLMTSSYSANRDNHF